MLVVDEAHYFGAETLSKSLSDVFTYRLALSATLERHNDEIGTLLLKQYFGEKCIEYTLKRAIEEKKLTPYSFQVFEQTFPLYTDYNFSRGNDILHQVKEWLISKEK